MRKLGIASLLLLLIALVIDITGCIENEKTPAIAPTPTLTSTPTPTPTRTPAPTPPPIAVTTPSPTASPVNASLVWMGNVTLLGADYQPIVLVNNPSAKDPSWNQLYWFLQSDHTDALEYRDNFFTCGEFAEMLHNNAEKAGWRTAYVVIKLGPSEYYAEAGLHALNAFETTDRGLVYIDGTGLPGEEAGPSGRDKGVDLKVGLYYIPYSIFAEADWSLAWENMGVVERIEVVQW